MIADDAAEMLTTLESGWPSFRWTEETEHQWLDWLRSYDVDVTKAAVRLLVSSLDRPPSWRQFEEAVSAVHADRARREQEARAALPVASDEAARRKANRQRMGGVVRDIRERLREDRKVDHDHRHGPDNCPLCARHDHSDRRVFGYSHTAHYAERPAADGTYPSTIVREPVTADHFTCPRCGDPQEAQYLVDDWTGEGIAFMKAQGITVTGSA